QQDHHIQTDRERKRAQHEAQALSQPVPKARPFCFGIFFAQMRARGDPEQNHRHHDDRYREQADFFRDAHAISFATAAPTRVPGRSARELRKCLLILCSRRPYNLSHGPSGAGSGGATGPLSAPPVPLAGPPNLATAIAICCAPAVFAISRICTMSARIMEGSPWKTT